MYLYWINALSCPENCSYDMLITTFTSGSNCFYSVIIAVMRIVYIVTKAVSPDIHDFAPQKCRVDVSQHMILMLIA